MTDKNIKKSPWGTCSACGQEFTIDDLWLELFAWNVCYGTNDTMTKKVEKRVWHLLGFLLATAKNTRGPGVQFISFLSEELDHPTLPIEADGLAEMSPSAAVHAGCAETYLNKIRTEHLTRIQKRKNK